ALTELFSAAKEFNRIVHIKWGEQKLHGSIVLVAQRQDVGPHGQILAPGTRNKTGGLRRRCFLRAGTGEEPVLQYFLSCCRRAPSARDDRRHRWCWSHPCWSYRSWRRAAGWACCRCLCHPPPCAGFRATPNEF